MIRIGTLCWLTNSPDPIFDGRVVEVVGPKKIHGLHNGQVLEGYTVDAPWLHAEYKAAAVFVAREQNLIPFSDPDNSDVGLTDKPITVSA